MYLSGHLVRIAIIVGSSFWASAQVQDTAGTWCQAPWIGCSRSRIELSKTLSFVKASYKHRHVGVSSTRWGHDNHDNVNGECAGRRRRSAARPGIGHNRAVRPADCTSSHPPASDPISSLSSSLSCHANNTLHNVFLYCNTTYLFLSWYFVWSSLYYLKAACHSWSIMYRNWQPDEHITKSLCNAFSLRHIAWKSFCFMNIIFCQTSIAYYE